VTSANGTRVVPSVSAGDCDEAGKVEVDERESAGGGHYARKAASRPPQTAELPAQSSPVSQPTSQPTEHLSRVALAHNTRSPRPTIAVDVTKRSSGTDPRHRAIGEALWELQAVFDDPGCFGDMTAHEASDALGSEVVGRWRDAEVIHRLAAFDSAERSGDIRAAARHLAFVRRKLAARFDISPVPSSPLDRDAASEYPAWRQLARKTRSQRAAFAVAVPKGCARTDPLDPTSKVTETTP